MVSIKRGQQGVILRPGARAKAAHCRQADLLRLRGFQASAKNPYGSSTSAQALLLAHKVIHTFRAKLFLEDKAMHCLIRKQQVV